MQEEPLPAEPAAIVSVKCPFCQSEIAPQVKFCKHCGNKLGPQADERVAAAAPLPPTASVRDTAGAAAEPSTHRGPVIAAAPSPAPAVVTPSSAAAPPSALELEAPAARRRNIVLLLGGGVVVLAVGAFAWYWTSTAVERQFRQAVEKGRLVSPAGDNALELYQQVVREKGSASSAVGKLQQMALPALQSKSDELFRQWYSEADIGDTRWADVQKLQDWLAELSPQNATFLARQAYAVGQVAMLAGRHGDALNHYRHALELQSNWPLALNGIGRACRNLRNMACAEEYYRLAAKADPQWIFPRQNLGGTYLELNRLNEAETEYLAALNLDPNRAGSRFLLAQLYERAKRREEACREYGTALKLTENLQRPPFDRELVRQRMVRVCR